MAKFKLKKYKFIFYPVRRPGATDWKLPTVVDYHFGNKHNDTINQYQYHRVPMGRFFSDFLYGDDRRYVDKAKFTESEATILLLKYIEDKLKDCRKEKLRLERKVATLTRNNIPHDVAIGLEYALTVNKRELGHFIPAAKIYRKKVRDLKKTKEYIWEQLLK